MTDANTNRPDAPERSDPSLPRTQAIVVVCPNPAVDVTYRVDALEHGASHRVTDVRSRPGGKGLNVARVLHQLGQPVRVLALGAGDTGRYCTDQLAQTGISLELTPTQEPTRRTVTVVDRRDATVFNEVGPTVTSTEWGTFLESFNNTVRDSPVAVLSGSLPPGVPTAGYCQMVAMANEMGVRCVLDTYGQPLREALTAAPEIVKPNAREAGDLLDTQLHGVADITRAAQDFIREGARSAVISAGAAGLVAVTPEGAWHAAPPERRTGNPTGAGDALTAALALGLMRGDGWETMLLDGVATAAAAVVAGTAGEIDLATAARARQHVIVRRL